MDIGILVALTGIYKLAEKLGLLQHIKKYAEAEFDALYEKLIQDTVFDGIAKKFFNSNHGKCFEKALTNIAPKYKTQKRRFLLHILTNPIVARSYDDLKSNKLPDRRIFFPIFESVLSKKNVEDSVDQFINSLYYCLAKDQEFINREVLIISDKIDRSKEEIIAEIRKVVPNFEYSSEAKEPFKISLSKLPTTHHALFGRDNQLKLLDDAWANLHCHLLCFVAFGGVGKTALVNEWLNQMELENWRDAERVYGWSFYSQGTKEDKQASADTFFEDALKFFGYTGEPITSPWDKGKKLAELIRKRKTLLILDGLEPLQYPPGVDEGRLRDQGLQALLKELARFNNGLAVITTRCKVAEIETTVGKTTQSVELENLSREAGRQLLREAGVTQGTDKELQAAAEEFGCHALALTLLGRYLAIRYSGEIRKRDKIKKLAYEQTRQGIHARHVMDSYEIWLKGTAELELLYLMGLFDRPAPIGAIEALKQPPVIKGVTDRLQRLSEEDWDFAIGRLRDLRLLSASEADKLDCHPLIREHFGEKLKARSQKRKARGENPWQEAHSRLYNYYKNLPEKELADTLEEMEPLFAAVAHGCQAGRYQETYDEIFFERIRRKNEYYIHKKLGAFGAELSAISNFFEKPWDKPILKLKDSDIPVILSIAGFTLRALGRLHEAVQLMQADLKMAIEQKDWKGCAQEADNLSELYLISGDVPQAINYARQSVDLADRSGDELLKKDERTTLAYCLKKKGEFKKAEGYFLEAESMQKEILPRYDILHSLPGFYYCEFLVDKNNYDEVIKRASRTLKYSNENWYSLLSIALDKLSLGRAYLLEAANKMVSTSEVETIFLKARDYLNQAVAGLREAGRQDHLPRALFARTFCYRIQNQFPQAWDDLEEAREIAERGEMKLWLVDYHLEASRLLISEFGFRNVRKAQELNQDEMLARLKMHVEQADKLVNETKYHRRDPEVELGYAGLFLVQNEQGKAREHLARGKKMLDKMGIRMWDFFVRELEGKLSMMSGRAGEWVI